MTTTGKGWNRTDWWLLLGLTILAAALRFYKLGDVPPGFQFDEAFNAIDAQQLLEGNLPLFLPANGGREVLYTYFQAGLLALFGSSVYTFRLASALWGTAAIPATYLLLRGILRKDSRQIAAFTALALAISYWHIHFSHYGIRVITMPVLLSALFGSYWAASHATTRRNAILLYLLSGAIAGLSVYANPTGRFTPLILLAYTAVLLIRHPQQRRLRMDSPIGGLLLAGTAAVVVFLPLGATFARHPEFFLGHASEVSVFADRVSGATGPLSLLATNALHVAGMFNFFGDLEWTHGISGRPVLDWVLAIPFYLGVGIWLWRLFGRGRRGDPDGDALWLLALWAVVMLAPSVLSEAAPNYSRTLPSLPASLLPIGLGLTWITLLRWPRAWMGYAFAGALLVVSMVITFRDYFIRYPQMQPVYYAYDVDKLDALELLRQRGQSAQVYFSPLWAEHTPVRWARTGSGIKTLDTADTVVLPSGKDAVFAFTGEETERAQQFAKLWPGASPETILDKYGKPLLSLVTISSTVAADWPPGYAPDPSLEARFDDAPTLLGSQAGNIGAVNLFWRSDDATRRNLTSFVHLIDRDGNRVAQADKLPGNGTYPTYSWSTGERVLDRAYPEPSDLCAGGDRVRAYVGWYEYEAGGVRRPRLDSPGDGAVAGEMILPVRPIAADAIDRAAVLSDLELGPATVVAYRMHEEQPLQPGSPFTLDLTLRANRDLEPFGGVVSFTADDDTVGSQPFTLAPGGGIDEGDYFCQRLRLRVPTVLVADAVPQRLDVSIDLDEQGLTNTGGLLTTMKVSAAPLEPTTVPAIPLNARISDDIALLGATVLHPDQDRLQVDLYWEAWNNPRWPSTAFVQLLGPDGGLVAQSDATPAGIATTKWVPGSTYVDSHSLTLPDALASSEYTVVAGMYDALSLERQPAFDESGNRYEADAAPITTLTLPR